MSDHEETKWLTWSGGKYPDDSTGDVIAAYNDGTIVLDDSLTTWNPLRALKFICADRESLRTRLAEAERERDEMRCNNNLLLEDIARLIPERDAAEARGVIMGLERARMILAGRVFADGEKCCNCDVEMRNRLDAEIAKAGGKSPA